MNKTPLHPVQIAYDPRGIVAVKPQSPATRLRTFENVRLGIVDNSKWNASKLLRAVISQLQTITAFSEIHNYTKPSFSRPATTALLDQIAAETDAVITAIGD